MQFVRYVVGAIGFLLVWVVVAGVIGFVMVMIFPPAGKTVMVDIGLDWRNIPGTLLGLLAGVQSFRRSVRPPQKKTDKAH